MKHIVLALIYIVCASIAQAYDGLDRPFDPNSLSTAEKRVLQGLLAREGTYTSRLDGAWGRGSQRALLQALPGSNRPTWRQVATFAQSRIENLVSEGWQLAVDERAGVTYLVPTRLTPRAASSDGIVFQAPDISMRVNSQAHTARDALLMHERIRRQGSQGGADYNINRDAVFVTSVSRRNGVKAYARSEPVGSTFGTVIVEYTQRQAGRRLRSLTACCRLPRGSAKPCWTPF